MMVALTGPEDVRGKLVGMNWQMFGKCTTPGMALCVYTDASGRILTVAVLWVCSISSGCVLSLNKYNKS